MSTNLSECKKYPFDTTAFSGMNVDLNCVNHLHNLYIFKSIDGWGYCYSDGETTHTASRFHTKADIMFAIETIEEELKSKKI